MIPRRQVAHRIALGVSVFLSVSTLFGGSRDRIEAARKRRSPPILPSVNAPLTGTLRGIVTDSSGRTADVVGEVTITERELPPPPPPPPPDPLKVQRLSTDDWEVTGPATIRCWLQINRAPQQEAAVRMTASDPAVIVPPEIRFAVGQDGQLVNFQARAVGSTTTVVIKASYNDSASSISIKVKPGGPPPPPPPPPPSGASFSPTRFRREAGVVAPYVPGEAVIVEGFGFGSERGRVEVGTVPASVISWSESLVTFLWPEASGRSMVSICKPDGGCATTLPGGIGEPESPEILAVTDDEGVPLARWVPGAKAVIRGLRLGRTGELRFRSESSVPIEPHQGEPIPFLSWKENEVAFVVPLSPGSGRYIATVSPAWSGLGFQLTWRISSTQPLAY